MLEMKIAISYGDAHALTPVKLGEGLMGYAALHKEAVLVPDVSKDSRYINAVNDVRSELVIPLLLKDRCDRRLRPREPRARRVLEEARRAADAAGVAGRGGDRERTALRSRSEPTRCGSRRKCASRSACRWRCCRRSCPKKLKGVDVAWHFDPARELGGDIYEFLSPEPTHPGRRRRRRVRQGRAGGALQLVRRRSRARPHVPAAVHARARQPREPADVAQPHPPRASARGVLLHAVLRVVRSQADDGDVRELGPAVSGARVRIVSAADRAGGPAARVVRRLDRTTR